MEMANQTICDSSGCESNKSTTEELAPFNPTMILASSTILIIIIVMALFGNSLVIAAFAAFHKLRNVTSYFIVSLAVADILVALVSMPLWTAYLITGPKWVFAEWVVKMWGCMDILCGVASIMHLCIISVERYMCISSPLTYHDKMTPKKAIIFIACIWLFSVLMAVLKIIVWNWPPPGYELIVSVFCFFVPLLIMIVFYCHIYKAAHHQIKKMIVTVDGKPRRFYLARELKAAKTIAVVIGGFAICWTPFFCLNLLYGLCQRCQPIPSEAIIVSKWMHYGNSVLNPIIYACMNREFRIGFRMLLSRACVCVLGGDSIDLISEARSLWSERGSLRSSFRDRFSPKGKGSLNLHNGYYHEEAVVGTYRACENGPSYV